MFDYLLLIIVTSSCSLFFKKSNLSFKFLFITRIYFYYIDIDIACFILFLIFAYFKSNISSSNSVILLRIILFSAIRLLFMYSWLMFFFPFEFLIKSCSRLSSFICNALLSLETIK